MITALALALSLSQGAAPPAAEAAELAKGAQWEELYLAYAAAAPKGYGKKDQARIGKALGEGCIALRGNDAVMAYSLGEKSVEFDFKADPALCAAAAAMNSDQRGAAEALLEKGKKRFPKDQRFPLELGRLALKEKDYPGAVKAFNQVARKSPQYGEAQTLLQQAKKGIDTQRGEDGLARKGQGTAMARADSTPARPGGPAGRGPSPYEDVGDSLTYKETTDAMGRQVMYNSRFRFKYLKAGRDFGQRADYEYRIRQTLDEVYDAASRVLGTSRKTPTDVILYSKEEFEAQFGTQTARTVAGLYSSSAIHMNHSATITEEVKATLVHEYTHAIIDELSGFKNQVPTWLNEGVSEWTEWKYLGLDGPPMHARHLLKQAAMAGRLPSLQDLSRGSLIRGNPTLNYAYSASAAAELVRRGGVDGVVQLIRDLSVHDDIEKGLNERVGKGLTSIEADLRHSLGAR